jgi:glycosyltransferase involved in cell wall biosynthesis
MNNAPLVTIGIPTYQRLEYLKQATESALSQSYSSIEVLVSDDGTSEEIAAWGQEMQRNLFPKFRYKRNPKNLGLAGNWNSIADDAQGDYLVIIGDDDRLEPLFISSLLPYLNAGATVAFCNQHVIDSAGLRLLDQSEYFTRHYHRAELSEGRLENPARFIWQNAIPMSAALIRTDLVRQLRFKEDLNTPEIELFARIEQPGNDFYFCPDYLAEYRVHSGSATSSGLRSERLSGYLMNISVSTEIEPLKSKLLANMLVNAVGRALLQKDWRRASELFNCKYFPQQERFTVRGIIYRLTLALPPALGGAFYSVLASLKKGLS